jgi:hypothetical protein
MTDLAKAADLADDLPPPDTSTDEGMRAFYIKHGIDPDEIARKRALYSAPGPFTRPGGTGPDELHEDERADLRASGFYDKPKE